MVPITTAASMDSKLREGNESCGESDKLIKQMDYIIKLLIHISLHQ